MNDRSPSVGTVLAALPVELARRERHDHAPEVLFLGSEGRAAGRPGGSVCVLSAYERSELVRRARKAAGSGDATTLGRIFEARTDGLLGLGHRRAAEPDPTCMPGSTPAIIRVSYRGTPIAQGILHEELDGLRVLLPCAGGALDPEGFAASTYVPPGAAAPAVATLVIVREPKLSDFERRALDRLPREMSQMALGDRLDAGTPVARLVELRAQLLLARRLT